MTPLERAVLEMVEAGYCHSLRADDMTDSELIAADKLVDWGLLARRPQHARWAERYVVTVAGSYALGSFRGAQ